jgi:flagellar basal-body rod modification protein FlgD
MTSITTSPTEAGSPAAMPATPRPIAGDMQSFLKLLTTQLRNQDPTQPLDPNEFTAQLAQFATVEQQITANQNMRSLLDLQRSSAMLAAAPLLGRQVEVASDSLVLQGGRAQEMRLPAVSDSGGATRARIAVTGANGVVLREEVVPLGAAASAWNWDGRDGRGRAVPDGTYRFSVIGVDSEGATRGALPATLTGTVTAVAGDEQGPRLMLGRLGVGMEALRRMQP